MATLNFNANEVEPSKAFDPIPAGKYIAVITDSEMKETRAGTGRYLQLEFEITDGEFVVVLKQNQRNSFMLKTLRFPYFS